MADEDIQNNIRSALQSIIAGEKQRLDTMFNKSDDDNIKRVEKLKPVIAALEAIKAEITDYPEIEFKSYGYMANVVLNDKGGNHRLSISTTYGSDANEHFTVEENQYFSFGDFIEKFHQCRGEDEVIRLVMDAIGKHIALKKSLADRKQK